MNVECLLRDSMKTKPKSNRGARQKTSTPKNVTRMNYNENPYGMSDAVKKAVTDASLNSYMYQDFYAVDLKKQLADLYGLTVDHVCIGAGSSAIIDMLGEVFINYGDEVVYCAPTYEAFPDMVSDNGGVRVVLPLTDDYCYDLDAMLAAITDKTKMVIVCNPTRMNYNENPYGMSDAVKKAVTDASLNSYMYQDFYAVDLKKQLADLYGLTVDHVCIGAGSSAIIDMLGEVFINYGDEVVYCAPTYEAFPDMVSDNGGVRVVLPLTDDYCYDLDAMLAAITDKTKMVIVCNPNNPTGTYVNSAKVEEFIRKLPDHVIPVVDEAYFEYVEDPTHYSLIKMIQEGYDRPLFVLRTFSKIYGMAGLRIGYTFADPLLIDELMKACQAWNVSYNALAAAQAALKDQEYIKKIKALTTAGREYLEDELTKLGCTLAKPCANFIYFDTHHDPKEIRAALAEQKIMISAFGFNRVSVGTEEQNKAFIAALKEILAAY